VERALEAARGVIAPRARPEDIERELDEGTLVVDTRSAELRAKDGELPRAVIVDRNVLEWRLDPTSAHRLPAMDDPDRRVIVVCNEGYASSLAAAGLLGLGLTNVTDLDGGYQAWREWDTSTGRAPSRARSDAPG
jgi:rhodanese-related sulfurtransferase